MAQRRPWRKFLAEGTAHQQVPAVGDQHNKQQLRNGGSGGYGHEACVFTCRGISRDTCQKSLKRSQARRLCRNAQRKGNGKISQRNGNAVPQPFLQSMQINMFVLCMNGIHDHSPDFLICGNKTRTKRFYHVFRGLYTESTQNSLSLHETIQSGEE